MADKETSGLTAAAALDGTELTHIVQGGNSRKATTAIYGTAVRTYTTTATAAGTTTLTVSSNYQQYFTGSTTQTVTLPVTSTLTLGQQFLIVNNSTGLVTVNSSGGNAVLILAGGTMALVTCILTSGTSAASWSAAYFGSAVASGKGLTVSNTLTFTGTDSSSVAFGAGGTVLYSGGAGGTPSSLTLTNATGLPISGMTSSTVTALGVGSLEVGHATDSTLARTGAGDLGIEGNVIYRAGGTDVPIADGGTGRSTSTTAYGLIAAGTTATGAHQTLAAGATTEILVGGGASALPVWTTATGTGAPARAGSPTFTGTVILAAATASGLVTLNGGGDLTPAAAPSTTAIGYLGAPQNIGLDSGNVTLALTDCGKHIYHSDGNTRTLTIPANGSVAFPVGTAIAGVNENAAGVLTIAITTDTLRWGSATGSRSVAANGSYTLLKVAATLWRLTGDGIT